MKSGEIQPAIQQAVENTQKGDDNMAALMGTYNHTIDAKGRMAFPNKLREALGDSFVITTDPIGCLYAYSNEEWESFTEKVKALTGPAAKAAVRRLYANAVTVEADKQGRILIPQLLREFAALEHDVTVIGNLNHAEIWNSKKYSEENEKFSDEELAAALDMIAV